MKLIQRFIGAMGILLIAVAHSPAQTPLFDDFPESATVRGQLIDTWLTGAINPARLMDAAECTDRFGNVFSVSNALEPGAELLAITVEPADRDGEAVPAMSGAPAASQGTWVLYRRLSDGLADHIRLYPVTDSRIFITLHPDAALTGKGKMLLDMNVYGAQPCRNIPLGITFDQLYTTSFSSIVTMTTGTVPWNLLTPDIDRYRDVASLSEGIRGQLGTLVYLEDGAFNEDGEPVLIKTGERQNPDEVWTAIAKGQTADTIIGGVNCSGFAKWVIDGIVKPRTGNGLFIKPLKTPTDSAITIYSDPSLDNRDAYFALDWTRNLASAVVTVSALRTKKPDVSGVDVTMDAFTGTQGYSKNIGYRISDLMPLMYFLAVTEPGHFYLGAVSDDNRTPGLREYHHIAILLPYFDENGQFMVDVFESAVETPAETFIRNNLSAYINLVRVRAPEDGYFQP